MLINIDALNHWMCRKRNVCTEMGRFAEPDICLWAWLRGSIRTNRVGTECPPYDDEPAGILGGQDINRA